MEKWPSKRLKLLSFLNFQVYLFKWLFTTYEAFTAHLIFRLLLPWLEIDIVVCLDGKIGSPRNNRWAGGNHPLVCNMVIKTSLGKIRSPKRRGTRSQFFTQTISLCLKIIAIYQQQSINSVIVVTTWLKHFSRKSFKCHPRSVLHTLWLFVCPRPHYLVQLETTGDIFCLEWWVCHKSIRTTCAALGGAVRSNNVFGIQGLGAVVSTSGV